MKLNIYIIFILCLVSLTAKAQYDVSFAHYWTMEPSFNPAAVGKESKLNIAGAYAIQMAGFEHNPNTMYAAADMPFYALRSYHGVGIQFMNDAIGLFTHKRFGLQYAYQPKLWGGRLSMGLQVSMLSENFDGSKAEVIDPDDPAITSSSVNGSAFDIGLGLYYRRHNWYAGFSVLHVTSPRVELGDKNQLDSGDISGRLQYSHEKRHLYAGLTYSPTTSVTVQVGGVIKGIRLGYSYEIYTSAMSVGNGSHEISVGYQMDIELQKKGRNLHKSVRIL